MQGNGKCKTTQKHQSAAERFDEVMAPPVLEETRFEIKIGTVDNIHLPEKKKEKQVEKYNTPLKLMLHIIVLMLKCMHIT